MAVAGLAQVKAGRAKTFTPKVVSHVTTEPVSAHTLNPFPDTDIDANKTNACRCGTYHRIREAVHRAAALQR